ncbi:MAG: hydroxypyruvate isomerase [Thiothrix sp.]|nr:MAG: hydroxypyruvate isomerase [Thiothrix sp.]
MSQFQLAACAEMLWRDRPIEWRAKRLTELGFGVGLWNWPDHDLTKLEQSGATFTIMNGYLRGRLADDEGAAELLKTAYETAQVGKRLGVARLNLHGTGLGEGGLPVTPCEVVRGPMWLKAYDTLRRMADLGEKEGVTFTLENLNLPVDHPGVPFGRAEDTLALVSAVNHPHLRLNLDLYHAQIGEGNLIELCRKSLPWIGEIQVADVPGRMQPGTGEINYRGIALALKAMGYNGAVGMEAFASGDVEQALEQFREAFKV